MSDIEFKWELEQRGCCKISVLYYRKLIDGVWGEWLKVPANG